MCTKQRSNKIPITTIHPLDYDLATSVLITAEGQKVIKEYLETPSGQLLEKETTEKLSK